MYLAKSQILCFARSVLDELGEVETERDIVNGGIESVWRVYDNYGLYISDEYGLRIEHCHNLVFSNEIFIEGKWELVLQELYRAIPSILKKRKLVQMKADENKKIMEDCRKYLVNLKTYMAPAGSYESGYYEDSYVLVAFNYTRNSGFQIFEKHRSKFLPWKKDLKLVFYVNNRREIVALDNGYWRKYVKGLIGKRKRERMMEQILQNENRKREIELETNRYLDLLKKM